MLNAIVERRKKGKTLYWPPAKIIVMPSANANIEKQNTGNKEPEESTAKSNETDNSIKFCEPVFKPKKHEFL